jgi:hypothetical protein
LRSRVKERDRREKQRIRSDGMKKRKKKPTKQPKKKLAYASA